MSFHTRPIRKRSPFHPLRKLKGVGDFFSRHRKNTIRGLLLLLAFVVVFQVMAAAYQGVRNFSLKDFLFVAGTDLKQDDNGLTNLVLLGDGGHVRDGADLVDTIMVVSLDHKNNAATLFSVPRDFYVRNNGSSSRINELYRNNKTNLGEEQAFELFKKVAGEITNLDIHYFVRVDFKAFVEAVDALEGVDLEIPQAIDDPYYPNETDDGYTPFAISAGTQHLDGETALKYVRSRKTTSDFDRAIRQQLVLVALREKALEKGFLGNAGVLKKLYGSLKRNVDTDMSLREMITLAAFAKKFDRERLLAKVIHDDPGQEGGFLYTPERELYGGQFVLVPFGDNLDLIHRYTDLLFHHRGAFLKPLRLEIMNATKVSGLAGRAGYQLNRFGFKTVNVDNLTDAAGERSFLEKSVIRYYSWKEGKDGTVIPDHEEFLQALQNFVKAEAIPGDPSVARGVDISIVLGADYDVLLVD